MNVLFTDGTTVEYPTATRIELVDGCRLLVWENWTDGDGEIILAELNPAEVAYYTPENTPAGDAKDAEIINDAPQI